MRGDMKRKVGLQQGDVDDLPFPCLLLTHQSRGDGEGGHRAGGDVGQRGADALRHSVGAGHAHQPGTRLGDEVVAGQRGVRAVEPEAREGADHQVRETRRAGRPAQARASPALPGSGSR